MNIDLVLHSVMNDVQRDKDFQSYTAARAAGHNLWRYHDLGLLTADPSRARQSKLFVGELFQYVI